jgi:hypothetical protein
MNFTTDAISFLVLGALILTFGLWARGREDQLLEEDSLDEDEHEYRAHGLRVGVVTMFAVGVGFIVAGIALALW